MTRHAPGPARPPAGPGSHPGQRKRRKKLRTSPTSRSGTSRAGKWPPRSNWDQCWILWSGSITRRSWPAEAIAARVPPAVRVEAVDERTCVVQAGADDPAMLALYLGMLDADFEVGDAPELADELVELAERYRRAAGSAGAARSRRVSGRRWRDSRSTGV